MKALIMQLPKNVNWIKVWFDIMGQLGCFFNEVLLFFAHVAKIIYSDLFFGRCYWIAKKIDTLRYSIMVHIDIASTVHNYYKEVLILISHKCDMEAKKYIHYQDLVKYSLKLIASVGNIRNVPDPKTSLLLIKT